MASRSIADPDPFDLLGVSEYSSDEAINAAWRRQIRLCHPDYAVGEADRESRLAKSIALNRAHDTLLDPDLKAQAILDRRDRTGPSAQSAYTSPEPPPARPRRQDTWAGTQWSHYRAGGHPEARDPWTYKEPATPPPATPAPRGYASLLARSPAPVRIVLIALQVIASSVWVPVRAVLRYLMRLVFNPYFPFDVHRGDEDD